MARILDNEKAETFVSLEFGMPIFTAGSGIAIVGTIIIGSGSFS
ncbi:hypothetical protein [Flavobacterium xylosi]